MSRYVVTERMYRSIVVEANSEDEAWQEAASQPSSKWSELEPEDTEVYLEEEMS